MVRALLTLLTFIMRRFFLLLMLVGCVPVLQAQYRATVSPQAFAQQTQQLREVQYSLQTLMARLESIELRQTQLESKLSVLEKGARFANKDDLAALRTDMEALRASQGEMREAVVAELSGKMAKIIQQQESAAQAKASAARQRSGYEHVVEAGETVSAIAQAYKVTTKSILEANKIKDPTKIRVGQKLFIPDP